jgi:hypothetical protein
MSEIYVAHDIEKTGSFLIANPVISIGFVVGDGKGAILETQKFNFQVRWPAQNDYGDFEPRCWDEFWSKQPERIVEACKQDPEPLEQSRAGKQFPTG